MKLVRSTRDFLKWFAAVVMTYLRFAPATTVVLVLCAVGSRLTNMFARLLPLKVILLAGSDGVPKYFRPFLSPEHKDIGLIVLTGAAIACYCSEFIFDAITEKLSRTGSRKVLSRANEIVLADQKKLAQSSYTKVTGLTANLVFAGIGFVTMGLADIWLVVFLLAFFALVFVFTAFVLRGNLYNRHRPIVAFIRNETGSYLGMLSVVSFIAAFIYLIAPFVVGTGGNILVAMVAVTFLRRTLGAVRSSVRAATSVAGQMERVNALVFKDRRVERAEPEARRTIRESLSKKNRLRSAEEDLADFVGPDDKVSTSWQDPINGVNCFLIDVAGPKGHQQYLERVFLESQVRKIDNEEFILNSVPREILMTPPRLPRFERKPFECQLTVLGDGSRPVDITEWREIKARIIENIWLYEPSPELLRAYQMSHKLLHERMTPEYMKRMQIAVDDRESSIAYKLFIDQMPRLWSELSVVPLSIFNPNIKPDSVRLSATGEPMILDWSAWEIGPLGADEVPQSKTVDNLFERVAAKRFDGDVSRMKRQIAIAGGFTDLERLIERGQYRSALNVALMLATGQAGKRANVQALDDDGAVEAPEREQERDEEDEAA